MSALGQPGLEAPPDQASPFNVWEIRRDFPILGQQVHGKPLVYLDNAATTQKPRLVLDAMSRYYLELNANVHRGVHLLSQKATDAYEQVRTKVQRFLHARDEREIVFVRGATEGINLVARTFGRSRVKAGDEILISTLEHHSNIVPWQMLCEEVGASLRVIPMSDSGELLLEEYEKLLTPRTRLVALVHVSNALGTVNPVKEMIQQAHARQIPVLVDGAQAVSHLRVDVQDLDCDFYLFSAHKIYGPTGIGALYGKAEWLESMPPFLGGGDMIRSVSFERTTFSEIPYKFEAGTPAIAEVIGMGAALDYVNGVGMEAIAKYEQDLLTYATGAVQTVHPLRLIGTAPRKASVLSFLLDGIHPHDIGTILDQQGIAIRAGHHCAQPLMDRLGIPATARASLAFYNTREEIDALVTGIRQVLEIFG